MANQPPTAKPAAAKARFTRAAGLSPGVLIADPDAHPTAIELMVYGPQRAEERTVATIDELPMPDPAAGVTWIDLAGHQDVAALAQLGERFALHPLLLEDVLNARHRPKVETFGDDLFIIAHAGTGPAAGGQAFSSEQVGFVVRPGLVITFRARPGPCFDAVRTRIRETGRRIRLRGADYLAYALLDAVVDGYLPVLDAYGDVIDGIEDRLLEAPRPTDLVTLHNVRRDLIKIRRVLLPMRESVYALVRDTVAASPFTEDTRVFLRDCYDHIVRTLDQVDGYRELAASLMELYLSTTSNRTNDVMKVLTMIATIFMPLGFIAGLYGMNFDTASPWNMPELSAPFGYFTVLAAMVVIALGLGWYFKRQGWL